MLAGSAPGAVRLGPDKSRRDGERGHGEKGRSEVGFVGRRAHEGGTDAAYAPTVGVSRSGGPGSRAHLAERRGARSALNFGHAL
jgi:hypothetical protein